MAGMQIRPVSDLSSAPVVPQVRSTAPPLADGAAEQVRAPEKKEQEKELENVVSRSKDGDTVQVSESSVEKLSEDAFGRMDIIGRSSEADKAEAENAAAERPAAEAENTAVERPAADAGAENVVALEEEGRNADEKVIPNITASAVAPADKPQIERPDEDEEEKEEAVKAIEEEDEKPKITSFAGYTEDQLRQLYQRGEISRQDYEKQVKLKEELKEEASGDTGEVNRMMKGVLGLSNEGDKDRTELKALFSEDSSDKIPAAERIAFMDAVEKNVLGLD